jgi:GR25 family glycosyltransferase involved in LPS biosynthesis
MKIYIVSCDKGRQERLLEKASPLNLDIEFVQSYNYDDPIIQKKAWKIIEKGDAYPTGVAATLGHMIAMQKLLDSSETHCMIGEDDIRFDKKFNEKLEVVLKYIDKCDVFTLGGCSDTVRIGPVTDTEYKGVSFIKNAELGNPWGAQLYIISREYAEYFLNKFSVDDLSSVYDYKFVTDCVIFDRRYCNRFSLMYSIAIEDPDEQTIAGNVNKMPIPMLNVNRHDFYF